MYPSKRRSSLSRIEQPRSIGLDRFPCQAVNLQVASLPQCLTPLLDQFFIGRQIWHFAWNRFQRRSDGPWECLTSECKKSNAGKTVRWTLGLWDKNIDPFAAFQQTHQVGLAGDNHLTAIAFDDLRVADELNRVAQTLFGVQQDSTTGER